MFGIDEMSNEARTTETSASSNSVSVLRLTKGMKPTTTKVALSLSNKSTNRYKGVVQQQNGHWGAQIYADHRRIWLGTFKSAAEAAAAYDSASIKLRNFDANSHRNFPVSEFTLYESDFQKNLTTEAVLNMIRDGSYQHKFRVYLKERSQIIEEIMKLEQGEGGVDQGSNNKIVSCTQLFQKELTPSDVGKLNRLVIPKKFAVKYLPFISNDQIEREEGEIGEDVEDVEVLFLDRSMRQWKFRYCYWRSSQSFVFTRGWNAFVKENNLQEKDVIVFYTCHVPTNVQTLEGQSDKFLMIDVQKFSESSSDEVMKTGNDLSSKMEEENKGGFMLFGVRIQ